MKKEYAQLSEQIKESLNKLLLYFQIKKKHWQLLQSCQQQGRSHASSLPFLFSLLVRVWLQQLQPSYLHIRQKRMKEQKDLGSQVLFQNREGKHIAFQPLVKIKHRKEEAFPYRQVFLLRSEKLGVCNQIYEH